MLVAKRHSLWCTKYKLVIYLNIWQKKMYTSTVWTFYDMNVAKGQIRLARYYVVVHYIRTWKIPSHNRLVAWKTELEIHHYFLYLSWNKGAFSGSLVLSKSNEFYDKTKYGLELYFVNVLYIFMAVQNTIFFIFLCYSTRGRTHEILARSNDSLYRLPCERPSIHLWISLWCYDYCW